MSNIHPNPETIPGAGNYWGFQRPCRIKKISVEFFVTTSDVVGNCWSAKWEAESWDGKQESGVTNGWRDKDVAYRDAHQQAIGRFLTERERL